MENHLTNAIEQMKNGEEAGLNYIYSKTYNFVYLRAKNIMKREEDIQLLMKDVYLQLSASASEVERESLYEWLGKRVYMIGCNRYRRKKAREATYVEIEKSEYTMHKSEDVNETTYVICNLLDSLPDMYQATMYAFYYDYMVLEDIAEVMGYDTGVIMNRLNYIRKYIQKAMEDYQEEKDKKGKLSFSVEAVCIALRKWSLDNCLGMTVAQCLYASICKDLQLVPSPIYLEGKEFAGVTTTVIKHKTDDLQPVLEEIEVHGRKAVPDRKKMVIAGGIAGIAVLLVLALVFAIGRGPKEPAKPPVGEQQQEQADPNKDEQNKEEPEDETDDQSAIQSGDGPVAEPGEGPETDEQMEVEPEYLLPEGGTVPLTREDLAGLTKEQMRFARNEIFARNGMIFGADDLDAYFRSKSWYEPKWSTEEFYDKVEMTLVEEENINLIVAVEEEME